MVNTIQTRENINQINGIDALKEEAINETNKTQEIEKDFKKTENKISILEQKKLGISISNLSEHDKGEILKYLSGDNYMQRGTIKTDSINNPKEFFESLNSLSDEKKANILEELKKDFKQKEKNIQDKLQNEKVTDLENKPNESEEKELNLGKLKEGGIVMTKIIDEITSLGIKGIGTTEDEKTKQINKFITEVENKNVDQETKDKTINFIKKSLNKMYLIKNKYLDGGNLSDEKVENLLFNVMGVKDEKTKKEFKDFIKKTGDTVKVDLKGPSLTFYIPQYLLAKILGFKIARSVYGFSIVESQGKIDNKSDYKKVSKKLLGVGGIKCTDEQIQFDDLKGCITIINGGKGQFKSNESVVEHEYQHVLNSGYLMPKEPSNINIANAMDEFLAVMEIERLTDEKGLYNYFLNDIKEKGIKEGKYKHTISIKKVLKDIKKDKNKYEEYTEKWETHKKELEENIQCFESIQEKTGLDRKQLANFLATKPIQKRKEIANSK